ncbi:MAG TPA: twin-arginine translocase subunit TatC [Rhodocyclaceae bacterium]|jgi:sec-independent protein translocase protein TatC|nr:twin-arginine translocase subunit TatC [Rhodocyclaceae bacterium]
MSDTASVQETFVSHLIELRSRLIRAIVGIIIVFLCLVNWARDIYTLLAAPMLAALPEGGHMIATDVAGAFLVPMKVTLMVAFVIALPYVLYQAWAFVAPGLYVHERRLVLPLIASSVVLFFIGMAFAYFVVFPTVFGFVNKFAPEGVAVMTDIDKYLSFVLTTFLAFGLTFEVPVIVVVLVRVGIVKIEQLKDARRYVIVGAFIVAAVFTPPDVVSQFLMAVPLLLLYELGIIMAGIVGRPDNGAALSSPED